MESLRFHEKYLDLLDQRLLPDEIGYVSCRDWRCVASAIKAMVVRGAPAIGAAAAFGMVLAARELCNADNADFFSGLENAADGLKAARPTAVNLAWAVDRMLISAQKHINSAPGRILDVLSSEARRIAEEDVLINRRIGDYGAELVPAKAAVLTHCNAGALATVGYGTALGVIRSAVAAGKDVRVYADETRPYLQGARLTALELVCENIPVTLITDSMAGFLMKQKKIDLVVVGADRIAANGDVANKVGTYSIAVLAAVHRIPFYVAAPYSSFDLSINSGAEIPIEERCAEEVTHFAGKRIAPPGIDCYNPSFDVTPAGYVSAIITEYGIIEKPKPDKVRRFFAEAAHGKA